MKCPRCNRYFKTQNGLERHVSECRRVQGYEVIGRVELDLIANGSLLPEMRISHWKSLLDERWARFGKVELQWDTEEESSHYTCFIRGYARDETELQIVREIIYSKMKETGECWIQEIQQELSSLEQRMRNSQ